MNTLKTQKKFYTKRWILGNYKTGGLLAHSPREFIDCGKFCRLPDNKELHKFDSYPSDMTNVGLRITFPMIQDPRNPQNYIAVLSCSSGDRMDAYKGIYLSHAADRIDGKGFKRLILQEPLPLKVTTHPDSGRAMAPLFQSLENGPREVELLTIYVREGRHTKIGNVSNKVL